MEMLCIETIVTQAYSILCQQKAVIQTNLIQTIHFLNHFSAAKTAQIFWKRSPFAHTQQVLHKPRGTYLEMELDFEMKDRPKWRDLTGPSTREIVDEIVKFRERFHDLKDEAVKFCRDSFAPVMAVDFIYNVNIGEQVGSQTRAETEDILMSILESSKETNQDTKRKETLNSHKAMTELHNIFEKEMEGSGLLTVKQVCDIHSILMKGLHPDAGKVRKNEAYTTWNGVYFYPPPTTVGNRLYAHIDCHNIYVSALPPKYSREEVEYVIKCAARIMFEFVNTHPFGDGNGRMCRLLANYVLHLITPFPVGICHTNAREGIGREDYVNAIVQCRDYQDEGPCDIAAMLAEGVWKGWKNLFTNLESRRESSSTKFIGPLILQRGKLGELSDKLDRLIENGVTLEKESTMESIMNALKYMNTGELTQHEYKPLCVQLAGDEKLEVKVLN